MATLQTMTGEPTPFRRRLEILEGCDKALLEADTDNRVRRAILHRSRPVRGPFHAGAQVFAWRGGTVMKKNREQNWFGPGQVICQDKNTVWVDCHGRLLKCAPEQLRHATLEELRGCQAVAAELAFCSKRLKEPGSNTTYADLQAEFEGKDEHVMDSSTAVAPENATEGASEPWEPDLPETVSKEDEPPILVSDSSDDEDDRLLFNRRYMPQRSSSSRRVSREKTTRLELGKVAEENVDLGASTGVGENALPPLAVVAEPKPAESPKSVKKQLSFSPKAEVTEYVVGPEAQELPTEDDRNGKRERENDIPDGEPPEHRSRPGSTGVEEGPSQPTVPTATSLLGTAELPKSRSPVACTEDSGAKQRAGSLERECFWMHRSWPGFPEGDGGACRLNQETSRRRGVRKKGGHYRSGSNHCFLGGSKQKKGAELCFAKMDVETRRAYREAMEAEWQGWLSLDAVEVIPAYQARQIPPRLRIPTRYVLTDKNEQLRTWENPNLPILPKARLVVLGNCEKELWRVRTDAPTLSELGTHLVFQYAASWGTPLEQGDIKQAFLNSTPMTREVYLVPPKEGLTGVRPGELLRPKVTPYGFCDAPRAWWKELERILTGCGWVESKLERGLYLLHDREGRLCGIGGPRVYAKALKKLQESVTWGKWETDSFTHCGRHIRRGKSGSVHVGQAEFTMNLTEVTLVTNRTKVPPTPEELEQARSALGGLSWLSKQSRPDLSYDVSRLLADITKGSRKALVEVNQLVRRAQQTPLEMCFPSGLNMDTCLVGCFSDASLGEQDRRE